jgi:hypothetical protein
MAENEDARQAGPPGIHFVRLKGFSPGGVRHHGGHGPLRPLWQGRG